MLLDGWERLVSFSPHLAQWKGFPMTDSPPASHCIPPSLSFRFCFPYRPLLSPLIPSSTFCFPLKPHNSISLPLCFFFFFWFLISPFVHQILTHTACRENARSPPAISRSVSLSITHMQTDNPPVHPTCQRKSLSDSCQVCPEVIKKKQETDEEGTFREWWRTLVLNQHTWMTEN